MKKMVVVIPGRGVPSSDNRVFVRVHPNISLVLGDLRCILFCL
jgi:hypothetical protein